MPADLGVVTGQRAVASYAVHAAPVPKLEGAEERHPDHPDGTQQRAAVAPEEHGAGRYRDHRGSEDLEGEPHA